MKFSLIIAHFCEIRVKVKTNPYFCHDITYKFKIRMKRITLAWALTLCSFITFIACSSPDVGERSVSIIPAPAQMTVGEGTFTIHPGIVAIQRDRKAIRHQAGFRLRQRIELHHLPRVDRSERVRRPAKSLWIESER